MSGSTGPRRRRIAGETPVSGGAAKKSNAPKLPKQPRVAKPAGASPSDVVKKTPSVAAPTTTNRTSRAPRLRRLRSTPLWMLLTAVVATASLVAGVVLCTMALFGSASSASTADERRAAAAAAGSASETIFSFTYDKLDEHLADSKALMTESFSAEFDKIAPSLTELAPQRQVQVQAVSRNTAPIDCGEDCSPVKVTALVFVDQVRLVGGSKEPTVFANRIEVTMLKVDGQWLVDDIRAL